MSKYSVTAYLLQWTTLLCNVAVLHWIVPIEMGIWGTFLLWEAALMVIRFGIVNAMMRDYPCLLGKGDVQGACRVVQVAAYYTLISGVFLLLFLLGLTAVLGRRGPTWLMAGVCFSIYSPAALCQSFFEATFRGGRQFALLSRIQLIAVFLTIVSLVLVGGYGFSGYCVRQASLAVTLAVLFYRLRPVKVAPSWNMAVLKDLFKTGLPLFVSNYLTRLINMIGQVAALCLGGQHLLGLYSPVSATISGLANLPAIFSTYFMPKQNFDYGRTGNAPCVIRNALVTGLGLTWMVLPLSLITMWFIPWAIREYLPSYGESTIAMQIATLAGSLRCFSIVTTCYATLKAWRPMFVNLGFLFITQGSGVALSVLCLRQQPLEAISLGLVLGQLVYIPSTLCLLKRLRKQTFYGSI